MGHGHSDWKHVLFYLGLSLLACHELDAVARHEWRLLPILNLLSDETGQTVFIVAHIPLFLAIFWLTGHRSPTIRRRSQMTVDAFLVVHAIAHLLLSGHRLYEFEGLLEWLLVYGGGVAGAAHLYVCRRWRTV